MAEPKQESLEKMWKYVKGFAEKSGTFTNTERRVQRVRQAVEPPGAARRELVAADYVYALKRHYDPRWKSNNLYQLEGAKILGLSELRRETLAAKGKPFDYDREVEGLVALDRYTWRVRLADPAPRFAMTMTDIAWAAVAREVVEFYDDMRVELYNVREDIGEQRHLAGQLPKQAEELRARLAVAFREDRQIHRSGPQ